MIKKILRSQISLSDEVIEEILGKQYSKKQLEKLEELCAHYYNHSIEEVIRTYYVTEEMLASKLK